MSGGTLLASAGRRQVTLLGRPSNNNRRMANAATITTSSNSGTNPWEMKIISSSQHHRGNNNYGAAAAAAGTIALLSTGAYKVATAAEDIALDNTITSFEKSATHSLGNILNAAQIATASSTTSSSEAALIANHPPLMMALQSMISLGFGGSGDSPHHASTSSASVSVSQPTQQGPTAASSRSSADASEEEGVGFGLRVQRVREFVSAQEWMSALGGGSVTTSSTQSSHSASRHNPDSYEVSKRVAFFCFVCLTCFVYSSSSHMRPPR